MDWENVAEAPEGRRATDVSRLLYEKFMTHIDEGEQGAWGEYADTKAEVPTSFINFDDNSEYTYIAHRRSRYTRPCISVLGHVGLASMDAVAGDVVSVFLGASMPVVVRPLGDGTYIRVGWAFVYGIMDGELLEGNPNVETIWLV
jgi:hypothetical protein